MKNGFTLIEMLVTVSMMAIIIVVGVPSFGNLINSNRLATQTNEFIAVMNYARSQAVAKGMRVSICASDPAASGNNPQRLCTGEWQKGFIVFEDSDSNCALDSSKAADGTTQTALPLRIHRGLAGSTGQNTLKATKVGDTTAVGCVGYMSMGQSANSDASIRFILCDPTQKKAKSLDFTTVGHISNNGDSSC